MEKSKSERIVLFISMVVFMCIVSPVSVSLSFTPLPVSLGSLAVLIVSMLMGWRQGLAIIVVYIVLGCIGMPVLAGWLGGLSCISSANVGYLVGYLIAAFIVGIIVDRHQFSLWAYFAAGLAGTVVLYLAGCISLMHNMDTTFSTAAIYGAVPFVLFDLIKVVFSAILCWLMRSHIRLFIKLS